MHKIAFIGAGNMASAMIGGIVKKNLFAPEEIVASARTKEKLDRLQAEYGIEVTTDNKECANAEMVFLCVKPVQLDGVIEEIREVLPSDSLVVSIAAGKKISYYEQMLSGTGKPGAEQPDAGQPGTVKSATTARKIIRCMPNTPALVGEGYTGVSANAAVTADELDKVLEIFRSFGQASVTDEKNMDAVVGISGSGPAYVYMFIDAMTKAGEALGLSHEYALESATQTVIGAAKMVCETGENPEILKQKVCSPGGTTIEAVKVLEERDLYGIVKEAVQACAAKSELMSR